MLASQIGTYLHVAVQFTRKNLALTRALPDGYGTKTVFKNTPICIPWKMAFPPPNSDVSLTSLPPGILTQLKKFYFHSWPYI